MKVMLTLKIKDSQQEDKVNYIVENLTVKE
jgi:hypothetical protein